MNETIWNDIVPEDIRKKIWRLEETKDVERRSTRIQEGNPTPLAQE